LAWAWGSDATKGRGAAGRILHLAHQNIVKKDKWRGKVIFNNKICLLNALNLLLAILKLQNSLATGGRKTPTSKNI